MRLHSGSTKHYQGRRSTTAMTGGSDGDAGSRGGGGGGSCPARTTIASAAGMPSPHFVPLFSILSAWLIAFLLRDGRGPMVNF